VGIYRCIIISERKTPFGRPRHRWEDNIKQILKKWSVKMWTGFIWLRIRISGGLCEHGNEPLGSVKGGEFLDRLSHY